MGHPQQPGPQGYNPLRHACLRVRSLKKGLFFFSLQTKTCEKLTSCLVGPKEIHCLQGKSWCHYVLYYYVRNDKMKCVPVWERLHCKKKKNFTLNSTAFTLLLLTRKLKANKGKAFYFNELVNFLRYKRGRFLGVVWVSYATIIVTQLWRNIWSIFHQMERTQLR